MVSQSAWIPINNGSLYYFHSSGIRSFSRVHQHDTIRRLQFSEKHRDAPVVFLADEMLYSRRLE